jgi:hypothetical protein
LDIYIWVGVGFGEDVKFSKPWVIPMLDDKFKGFLYAKL